MEPTYDPRGKVIAWLNGENIYYLDGKHAAVLNGENLYGRRGQHLGVFLSGFFRGHRGGAVAFMQGANGGPLLPLASLPPLPPLPALAPLPAVPQARSSSHNQLLVGRLEHEGSSCAWGRRLQSVLLLESVSCGGLKNRLAPWRAALGRDACHLGEQALAERTARRFALQGGRDALGSKTEEEANSEEGFVCRGT